jgi:hypothetical protein
MPESVEQLTVRIGELAGRLTLLAADPTADPISARELLDALGKAERDRRRLLQRGVAHGRSNELPAATPARGATNGTGPHSSAGTDSVMTVRERVLAGLELLGVPSRAGLVSIASVARTGLTVESRQLASLRRSELASWRSAPDRRPAYVVPALHDRRFEPLRGTIVSSAWEPWRRLVGPLSPRADHLRAAIRVAEHSGWARQHSDDVGARLERLLWRLARSVPGALDASVFDVERVIAAARAELAIVDREDREHREAAAVRLGGLSAEQQLFGAGLRLVEGEASQG